MVRWRMPERTLRDTTIEFVAELCEPVGPFTFAGYGGRIAALRHQIHQDTGDDLVAGVFAAEAKVRELRRAWVESAPLPAAIDVLIELYAAPPPEAGRDSTDWRDELMELLYLCGRRDLAAVTAGLQRGVAAHHDALAPLAAELHAWFDDDEP